MITKILCLLALLAIGSSEVKIDRECIVSKSLFQKDHHFEENLSETQFESEFRYLAGKYLLIITHLHQDPAQFENFEMITDAYNVCIYYFSEPGKVCENIPKGYIHAPY